MLFEIRSRQLFGATATLWVLFAFAIFLDSISAAPQQLFGNGISRRTGNAPGLGVELEMARILIQGKDTLTPEQREDVKGSEMTPICFAGGPKTNWELTAEVNPTWIYPEAIVDGLTNMVGDHKTAGIGEEIFKFFVGLPTRIVISPIAFIADLSSSAGRLGAMPKGTLRSYYSRL